MDPDANLAETRAITDRLRLNKGEPGDAARLSELVSSLDDWLRRGGFLPRAWQGPWPAQDLGPRR